MPASIFDPVSSALHLSLTADDKNQNDLLDNRLISSAKSVLLTNIEFEETGTYQSDVLDGLKSKYIILKVEKRLNEDKSLKKDPNSSFTSARTKQENGLPSPKKVLYPVSAIRLGWESGWQVGSGMQNVGNTCYLNSTLQALFHVPAFANWLVSETHHAEKCSQNGGCVICGMRKTLLDTQNSNGPIKPWQVYSKLRLICRHLTPGRQEDAHEFLRYLVESMEKTYLSGLGGGGKQLEQYSKETTPLNQLLGGYLRSAVRCLACGHVSTTFQHFQDLLVDARKASTLDEALDSFFSRERLEDLGYKCEACNKKVSATKQFFVERPPMVLCIALKRFSLSGGKVSKHVQFKPRISLKKFMFHQGSQAMLGYRLVSVVTHLGPSQNCGHYTAVGLGPGGVFYHFDDSCVRAIPMSNVLGTNAYIMFYELEKTDLNNVTKNKLNGQSSPAKSIIFTKKENEESLTEKKTTFIGPVLPDRNKENSPIKSKFSPIKINGDTNSKPITYRIAENSVSTTSTSNEKPQSKLTLNLTLTTQSQGEHSNGINGKFNNNKTTFSNDNGSLRKAISNVLSPSKSANIIQNGTHVTNGEVKASSEIKSISTNLPSKQNGVVLNGTSHTNGEIKMKNKINGDEKYNPVKPVANGSNAMQNGNGNHSATNGNVTKPEQNGSSKKLCALVPYGLESGDENQDDEEDDDASVRNKLSAPRPQPPKDAVTTKATDHSWKVSNVVPVAHHSPSLNGVVNSKLIRSSDACNEQPTVKNGASATNGNGSGGGSGNSNSNSAGAPTEPQRDVVAQLQRLSHRGYGAPVTTWNGHHAQLNRQVFEDKKGQKRSTEEDDEMDRGRNKKVRHNNYNSNKPYHNNFNAFQNVQNQRTQWANHNKGSGRPNHYNNKGGNFRNRARGGRFVSPYQRHAGGGHYGHNHSHNYSRNR